VTLYERCYQLTCRPKTIPLRINKRRFPPNSMILPERSKACSQCSEPRPAILLLESSGTDFLLTYPASILSFAIEQAIPRPQPSVPGISA
jgi:hypothetical protein